MEKVTEQEGDMGEIPRMMGYIGMYIEQKIDLLLQHYLLDPADALFRRLIIVAVIITFLVFGILVLVTGGILLLAEVIPLWASLLVVGGAACIAGGGIAYHLFASPIILETPVAEEQESHDSP